MAANMEDDLLLWKLANNIPDAAFQSLRAVIANNNSHESSSSSRMDDSFAHRASPTTHLQLQAPSVQDRSSHQALTPDISTAFYEQITQTLLPLDQTRQPRFDDLWSRTEADFLPWESTHMPAGGWTGPSFVAEDENAAVPNDLLNGRHPLFQNTPDLHESILDEDIFSAPHAQEYYTYYPSFQEPATMNNSLGTNAQSNLYDLDSIRYPQFGTISNLDDALEESSTFHPDTSGEDDRLQSDAGTNLQPSLLSNSLQNIFNAPPLYQFMPSNSEGWEASTQIRTPSGTDATPSSSDRNGSISNATPPSSRNASSPFSFDTEAPVLSTGEPQVPLVPVEVPLSPLLLPRKRPHISASPPSSPNSLAVVRTSKNPFETLHDIGISDNGPCIKCWVSRKQCSGGIQCTACAKSKPAIPAELCLHLRFTDCAVFSKWKEPSYTAKLLWPSLHRALSIRRVLLRHEKGGPTFEVECCPFKPESPDHVQIHWKERTGWGMMETTAWTLKELNANLTPYISRCVDFFTRTTLEEISYLAPVFKIALIYRKVPLVHHALQLWAASRLLTKGWEIHGPEVPEAELLGMTVVDNPNSPLHGCVPAPRVIQNQLDSLLEVHVAQTESSLLTRLEQSMKKRQRGDWICVFLAVTIVLHTLERDTWRLLYWLKHQAAANKWRHPLKPVTLVEKSVYFTNVLIAHFGIAGQGLSPLQLDWNQAKNAEKVDNNADIIESMKKLQLHTRTLKETFPIEKKGRDRYDEQNLASIDLTLSARCLMQSADGFAHLDDLVYF